MEHTKENKPNVMVRVATFIVDKRNLIFLLVGALAIVNLKATRMKFD